MSLLVDQPTHEIKKNIGVCMSMLSFCGIYICHVMGNKIRVDVTPRLGVLDRGDLLFLKHVGKYFSKPIVMQV